MDKLAQTSIGTLAEHLRDLRTKQNLTLQNLAEKSGVSRASLSRIEKGDVSPTVETLGRIATALSLPISQLLVPLEASFQPLVPREEQPVWEDGTIGFMRQNVSPPSRQLMVEIVECHLSHDQIVRYARPAKPGHEHHLVLLSGTLCVALDDDRHYLKPGDCLRYHLRGASSFETGPEPAHYMIALV